MPHVIGYRTSPITYAIARRVVKIPHIGLVNVVAGREVSKEFVQERFVPEEVAAALLPLLDDSSDQRTRVLAALAEVRSRLGDPGASRRVAEMIVGMVGS